MKFFFLETQEEGRKLSTLLAQGIENRDHKVGEGAWQGEPTEHKEKQAQGTKRDSHKNLCSFGSTN